MRPSDFKRPTDELGKIPSAIRPHIESLSGQIDELTQCLQGNTNFRENMNAAEISYVTNHGLEKVIKTNIRGKAKKVIIDWTSAYSPWSTCWRVIDETTIAITVNWADISVVGATVNLTVFGA